MNTTCQSRTVPHAPSPNPPPDPTPPSRPPSTPRLTMIMRFRRALFSAAESVGADFSLIPAPPAPTPGLALEPAPVLAPCPASAAARLFSAAPPAPAPAPPLGESKPRRPPPLTPARCLLSVTPHGDTRELAPFCSGENTTVARAPRDAFVTPPRSTQARARQRGTVLLERRGKRIGVGINPSP